MPYRYALLTLTAVLALSAPRPASACSCVAPTVRRTILPRHGARDVPTNARLRVFITGGVPDALRWALANEYRLRDTQGKLIVLDRDVVGTRLDLKPKKPLMPNSRHALEQVFAFGPKGHRLTDTQRWRLSWPRRRSATTPRPKIRRAWFTVAAFHTGAGSETRKLKAPPAVKRVSVGVAYGGGDCGPGASMRVEFTLPGGTSTTDVVELEVRGKGLVATIPAPATRAGKHDLSVGNMMCFADKVDLGFANAYAARLRLRSITGAASRVGAWKRARTRGRRPTGRGNQAPVNDAAVKRWLADPLVKFSAAAGAAGPAGCAHGLRSERKLVLSRKGAASSYEAIGSAAWHPKRGGAALIVDRGKTTMVTFGAGRASPRLIPLKGTGFGGQLLRQGDQIYFASVHTGPKNRAKRATPTCVVTRHAPDGKQVWRAALAGPGGVHNTKPRLALGTKGLLVVWEHWPSYGSDKNLQWALLEPATGKIVHQRKGIGPNISSDTHLGLVALGGAFYAIYTPNAGSYRMARKPELLVLDARGRQKQRRTIELPDAGPGFDMAAHGKRLVVAFSNSRHGSARGRMSWALLDVAGKPVFGPVVVSKGVGTRNRKPRITADAKGRFAVAWEAYPARTLYVAVVDGKGVVSPPLQLSPEQRISTVALTPTKKGFLATYSVDYSTLQAEWLGCRAKARPGPPSSIGPVR